MSLNPPPLNLNENSLQPFETLPDELLLSIFQCLDPLKRSLLLSICKKWNDALLLNRSLWTVVHLPASFSFEESVSTLQLFNVRSGFRLRHVILCTNIEDIQQLHTLFDELEKSAGSLRLLSLVQSWAKSLNKQTRSLARKRLPNINTLNLLESGEDASSMIMNMLSFREELGIRDSDENLRYLRCTYFSESEQNEQQWLSVLIFFQTDRASVQDLQLLLKCTQFSLKSLHLYEWSMLGDDRTSSEYGRSKASSDEADMKRLQYVEVPAGIVEARSLSRLLGRGESVEMLDGEVNRLIDFKISNLKSLEVWTYNAEPQREEMDLLRFETESLFQQNKSVEKLVLQCRATGRGGETQINLILELLRNRSKAQSPPEIHLPNLVKLTIADPVKLDGKLLSELVQERKLLSESFKLAFADQWKKEISIKDWVARGWMN